MSEHDDLSNFLKSPGWLRFTAYAQKTWSENILSHVQAASNDRDDLIALNKLRQVVAAQNAVLALLAWPQERLSQIEAKTEQDHRPPSLSRRGGL